MGIDVEIQAEAGTQAGGRIGDPGGLFSQFVALAYDEGTRCLRFIDPYGDTKFNQLQLKVLDFELIGAIEALTPEAYRRHRQDWVDKAKAAKWQPTVIEAFQREVGDATHQERTAREIRDHAAKVHALVREAIALGPHTYVKFIGD